MKIFSLIYKDALPYLRQKNPVENNGRIISEECWQSHEDIYIKEAILLLNPVFGRREYFGSELEMFWQYHDENLQEWINCSEPNFIGTDPNHYQQVFQVKPRKEVPYQERVKDWVGSTFSEAVLTDIPQRCFRFMEEAIELGQSLGVTREDMYRLITYTYGRPPGETYQEIGGVCVTLNALATAVGVDVPQAAEAELTNNIKNAPAIREKWLAKKAVLPLNSKSI